MPCSCNSGNGPWIKSHDGDLIRATEIVQLAIYGTTAVAHTRSDTQIAIGPCVHGNQKVISEFAVAMNTEECDAILSLKRGIDGQDMVVREKLSRTQDEIRPGA